MVIVHISQNNITTTTTEHKRIQALCASGKWGQLFHTKGVCVVIGYWCCFSCLCVSLCFFSSPVSLFSHISFSFLAVEGKISSVRLHIRLVALLKVLRQNDVSVLAHGLHASFLTNRVNFSTTDLVWSRYVFTKKVREKGEKKYEVE